MIILKLVSFNTQLKTILRFISLSNPQNAKQFKNELIVKIDKLSYMPYKFRKSIYFEDEDIRDLIFKGYIIPYKINTSKKQIIIIGIKKYQSSF